MYAPVHVTKWQITHILMCKSTDFVFFVTSWWLASRTMFQAAKGFEVWMKLGWFHRPVGGGREQPLFCGFDLRVNWECPAALMSLRLDPGFQGYPYLGEDIV